MLKSYFPLSHLTLSAKWQRRLYFTASFLTPALIFFIYFACRGFNILTVDLGQQYVDFFAFLRRNLLRNPLQLIYSFQNGLGGDMIGTCAYYLASPFNLLIFLFPAAHLPFALLVIITLKIGSMGLSAYYYWQKKAASFFALAASLAYSLSSYVIANHFNLMWLDALILLPLLVQNIDCLLKNNKDHLLFLTFLLWVTNFYVGLMALFFGFLYFLSQVFSQENDLQTHLFSYLKKSIEGTLLAAFLLLPTFTEILANKSSQPPLEFAWQFNPLNELAKLTIGSYNFQQMQTGLPNIYFTMPFLFLTVLYFTSRQIKTKAKLINLGLLVFLLLSLFFQPLILLWHLGQFPTWYPGRFTFVLIFFCLNLAVIFLAKKEKLQLWQKLFLVAIAAALWSYCYLNKNNFTFLNKTSLMLTGLFLLLALIFTNFVYHSKLAPIFLFLIILAETSCNLIYSFNNLAYQDDHDYEYFSQKINQVTREMQSKDSGLYRTEKNFSRSDDDSFTANYNGISFFNSMTNQKTLNFLTALGYLHNSNSVTNSGGTPISDDILGLKYYIEPNSDLPVKNRQKIKFENFNQRFDLTGRLTLTNAQLALYQNQTALPLLFLSPPVRPISLTNNAPLTNQQDIWQAITGYHTNLIKKMNMRQNEHQLLVNFISPKLADYYLQLPPGLDERNLILHANQRKVNIAVRDSQAHLLNLGYLGKGQKMILRLTTKESGLNLQDIHLWQINTRLLKKEALLFRAKQPSFHLTSPLVITSKKFQTKKEQDLVTTIPDSANWLVFDHHRLLKKEQFANTFLAAHLPKGKHQLTIIYLPFAFLISLLISLATLLILLLKGKQK